MPRCGLVAPGPKLVRVVGEAQPPDVCLQGRLSRAASPHVLRPRRLGPLPALAQTAWLPTRWPRWPSRGGRRGVLTCEAALSEALSVQISRGLPPPPRSGLGSADSRPPRAPAHDSHGQPAPPWPPALTWTGVTTRGGRPAGWQGLPLSAQHQAGPELQGQCAEPWGDGPQATQRLQPPPPRLPAGLPLKQGKSPVTGPGRPGHGGRAGHAQLLFQHMGAVGPGRCLASAPRPELHPHPPSRLLPRIHTAPAPLACVPEWGAHSRGSPSSEQPGASGSRTSSAHGAAERTLGRGRGRFQRMALVGGGLQCAGLGPEAFWGLSARSLPAAHPLPQRGPTLPHVLGGLGSPTMPSLEHASHGYAPQPPWVCGEVPEPVCSPHQHHPVPSAWLCCPSQTCSEPAVAPQCSQGPRRDLAPGNHAMSP